MGFDVFTPMRWRIKGNGGEKQRILEPVIQDLLFVYSDRETLDDVVRRIDTLQYRFVKNGKGNPLVVNEKEMQRFIHAVKDSDKVKYYLPEELSAMSPGRKIRIIGGPMDGYQGKLLTVRGSKVRRIIVEIPKFIYAGIEINPNFIEFLD